MAALTWLPDVLRGAGCTVIEEDGWQTRGRPGTFTPRGIMLHHDASPTGETSNGVDVIRDGRPGLNGPLAQLWLSYDGTWHVVAAGRANHAGEGQWRAIPRDQGNTYCIGIETDHTTNETWTGGQRSAALAGVAALADRLGIRTQHGLLDWFCAHKEYAAGRKPDPDPLDMTYARAQLLDYTGEEEDTFMDRIEARCTVADPLPAHEWTTLRVRTDKDDGALHGVMPGPCRYLLNAAVTLVDVPMGAAVMLRAVETGHEIDDVHTSRDIDQRGAVEHHGTEHFTIAAQGSLDDGEWLRLQIHTDTTVSVTEVRAAVTVW